MRPFDERQYTCALPYPQVYKREVGHRLVYKRFETVRTGVFSKGAYLTVRDVAQALGKSCSTVYELVRTGKIRAYQNYKHGKIRISEEFLDEYRSLASGAE